MRPKKDPSVLKSPLEPQNRNLENGHGDHQKCGLEKLKSDHEKCLIDQGKSGIDFDLKKCCHQKSS